MELTREILDQITKDATFARDIESIIVSVHPETVLALVAEIERQREEIAALQEALEAVWDMGHETIMKDNVTDLRFGLQAIKNLALRYTTPPPRPTKAAPAPEPAPRRIIPNVRVKYTAIDAAHRSGQLGVIVGSAVDYLEVEFEDGLVEGVKRTELQSV